MNTFPGGLPKANPIRLKRAEAEAQMQISRQQIAQIMGHHVANHDSEYEDVLCECGHRYFDHVIRKKKISGMDPANPFQPDEQFIDLIVNLCKKCGKELILGGPHKNYKTGAPERVVR